MATITEILWWDIIKNSRTDINNNFANLNNSKLEDITSESIWDLSDVNTTWVVDWDTLVWNETTGEWEPWEWWAWESAYNDNWNSWSAITIDFSSSNNQIVTVDQDTTITIAWVADGQKCYMPIYNGWDYTITWAENISWNDNVYWAWDGAPTLTAGWRDILTITYLWPKNEVWADYGNNFWTWA